MYLLCNSTDWLDWRENNLFLFTSAYTNRANLPKEVLAYPEFPFPEDIKESFLPQNMILDYIESYAKHFNLYDYIQVCVLIWYRNKYFLKTILSLHTEILYFSSVAQFWM